ncbi:hypothetical protein BKA64DRAFT_688398 [Cadophora sp. MPI-SDFR-AT-0126]|nr:hypothetical protein BKA64DRAFT_688398 [Leotiomycetes sp. MPI-SDFR-AT-0126]
MSLYDWELNQMNQQSGDEMNDKPESLVEPPEVPILTLLRHFSDEENIPLRTIDRCIQAYSQRCRLAHPISEIRRLTSNRLWSELEHHFDAELQNLKSRELPMCHEFEFMDLLRIFKEITFADEPTVKSHAESGEQMNDSVLSLKSRLKIQADIKSNERKQQRLERTRDNRDRVLSVQKLGHREKPLIHDDISDFWDGLEIDQ